MENVLAFSRAHTAALAQDMGSNEALGFALAADYASRTPVVNLTSRLAGMPGTRSLVRLDIAGLACVTEVPEALTGEQVSLPTLPSEQIPDFTTLVGEYRKQVEYCTCLHLRKANLFQRTIGMTGPHLFRSLFIEDCLVRGHDMRRGGPRYNHGPFLTEGVANTASPAG